MQKLTTLLLTSLLVACGGGGGASSEPTPPPAVYPEAGAVLSSECQEYTLVERIADGVGGSTEEVTVQSPDCGWNPTPEGTPAPEESYCEEPYTYFKAYHDGAYGFYYDEYEDSLECGYLPPSLEVTIDNTYGDRFRPVVVTVDYRVQGEPAEWTYEVEAGRAVKVDDTTLHIYGDGTGNSVDFYLTINDETFTYQLKAEPRCIIEDGTDCLGHRQVGGWDLIYYGEPDVDQQMVDVEVAVTHYSSSAKIPFEIFEGDSLYDETARRVALWNRQMERDGIYVRFILKTAWVNDIIDLNAGERFVRKLDVDIGLGRGTTYPNTCGVARPNFGFYAAGFGFADCLQFEIDLHELGHVVGLAHGPNNSAYPREGYIFPEFGHGDYNQCIGGRTDDIMSYGTKEHFYNSTQDCADRFGNEYDRGLPAGDRFRADSAYHWNRIRYDLSLIHDEHAKKSPAKARQMVVPLDDDRPLIID